MHKIWVMHFCLTTTKINLFVKIKERCWHSQPGIGTGYSEKLCRLSPWVFKTQMDKASSNQIGCLSWPCFDQEVGLETSWHPLQHQLCYEVTLAFSRRRKHQYTAWPVLSERGRIAVPTGKMFDVWMKYVILQTELPF